MRFLMYSMFSIHRCSLIFFMCIVFLKEANIYHASAWLPAYLKWSEFNLSVEISIR